MANSLNNQPNINEDLLKACIHCGLCLPACPTYLATGRELESPRGRIYLLNLWQQGAQPFSERMAEHIDSCLGCLACQTACPSGVQYDSIFNQAKAEILDRTPRSRKLFRFLILKWLLPNEVVLQIVGKLLWFWQRFALDRLAEFLSSPLQNFSFVKQLRRWQSLMPKIPLHKSLVEAAAAYPQGKEACHLFKGCAMDIFYNDVNINTLEILAKTDCSAEVPEQTCCGALALHCGEQELAQALAIKNIKSFSLSNGPIVCTASGCTAALKSYAELFDTKDDLHNQARQFADRVQDISEFLANKNFSYALDKFGKPPTKQIIAYHAACHLAHAQGIRIAPKALLENYAQAVNVHFQADLVKLVELQEEEYCCGSAGIYNLIQTELSDKILERKIEMLKQTGANIVVTTNPGCILQLQAGIAAHGLDIKVIHMANLLAKGY